MTAMRARMRKEIEMLESDPPFGVSAWPKDNQLDKLEAQIVGPEGSPYENGTFLLKIDIPERYPFEPPKVKFQTPIFHPNIDDAGRICLDTLKMQPKGSWMPSVNISTLLTTIRLLMAEPNADDGLMPDITDLFKHNRDLFNRRAVEHTRAHACGSTSKQTQIAVDKSGTGETKEPSTQQAEATKSPSAETKTDATMEKTSAASDDQSTKRSRDDDRQRSASSSDDDDFSDESDFSDDDDDTDSRPKRQRT